MITLILRDATDAQLHAAACWTADNLHVPLEEIDDVIAVAYVVRHYKAGELEGWDGFITDLG